VPELPEVEATARLLSAALAGSRIESVLAPGINVLRTVDPPLDVLVGRTIEGVTRRGKVLVVEVSGGLALAMHMMSAGRVQLYDRAAGPRDRTSRLLVRVLTPAGESLELRLREFGKRQAADGTRLGRSPASGRKVAEVYKALLAAEPHATAERQRELRKLGNVSVTTPSGYLAFTFLFFVLAISLFCCAQLGAARHEEADERLETLLALPVGRGAWLGGRLALAAGAAVVLGLAAGVFAWAGARSQGVSVSLPRLLEAGANALPAALLFLGIGALAFALLPRAATGIAYGLVSAAFVWQLFGALLGAPAWLLDLSPFQHVGLVPAQPFKAVAAVVMIGIAAACAAAALAVFRVRDLKAA